MNQPETTDMKYGKPKITLLGKASEVIQGNKKQRLLDGAGRGRTPSPAYELDE